MTNVRTTIPFPTQPWEVARARFLEGLPDDDVQRFKDAALENLFYDSSAAQKKHARGSKSWAIQERITPLIEGIDDYGKALDVFSNTYPLILCPLWGSVRVLLHIAQQAGKFQEKLVDMFARIGDVLPRFRIYEKLFRNHERLLAALSMAYLDILRFCISAKDLFVRAKEARLPMSIVCMGIWKPFRHQFESFIEEFRKHQKRVEKEAGLAHMIEFKRSQEIELANRALQIRNGKIQKRHRILSSIPSVDYQLQHNKIAALRHPGTNSWIQRHSSYTSWLASDSGCLVCYGIPGSGKSVLASSIVDHLIASRERGTAICYYYCDYTNSASLDVSRLVATLIVQLLVQLPLDAFDEQFESPFVQGNCTPSLTVMLKYISALMERYRAVFVVLDGLDELPRDGQTSTLEIIRHFTHDMARPTRMLVTSRSEEYLLRNGLHQCPNIDLKKSLMQEDISSFIEYYLSSKFPDQSSPLSGSLREHVKNCLIKGANGMFLWVKYQLYDIAEAVTEDQIRRLLASLPKDLNETYMKIVQKIAQGPSGNLKIENMERVFKWVVCSRRPLNLQELEEAVSLRSTDTYLHAERVASDAGQQLVSNCGNLVVYNREDGTVTLAHQTVQQYLCRSSGSVHWPIDYPVAIHFDPVTADMEIGDICIAYLHFSDFETQIVKLPASVSLNQESMEHVVWGNVPFSKPLRGLLSRLRLNQASRPDPLTPIILAGPVAGNPSETLRRQYLLLEYITEFWVSHTSRYTANTPSWPTFVHTCLHRQLSFEYRPWNLDPPKSNRFLESKPTLPYQAMFSWAIDQGVRSCIEVIVSDDEIGLDLEKRLLSLFRPDRDSTKYTLVKDFLDSILSSKPPTSLVYSFWDASFILRCSAAYGPSLLSYLREQLVLHSSSDANARLDSMFYESMYVALGIGDDTAVSALCPYLSHDQMTDGLIDLCKGQVNQPSNIRCIFALMAADRPLVPRIADIFYALDYLVQHGNIFQEVPCIPYSNISTLYQWALVIVFFAAKERGLPFLYDTSLIYAKLSNARFMISHVDPDQSSMSTPEAYARFKPLADQTILVIATNRMKECMANCESIEDRERYMAVGTTLLSRKDLRFTDVDFESSGLICLFWAIDMSHLSVVKAFVPHCKYYTRAPDNDRNFNRIWNHMYRVLIVVATYRLRHQLMWDGYLDCLAELEWPKPVLDHLYNTTVCERSEEIRSHLGGGFQTRNKFILDSSLLGSWAVLGQDQRLALRQD